MPECIECGDYTKFQNGKCWDCYTSQNVELSQGEKIVCQFFSDKQIKFQIGPKIVGLKNDTKRFRRPDFYLPRFNMCIEFLGKWNEEAHKSRYRQKKEVYRENNIPCVYFYPDNLGFFESIFNYRMEEELRSRGMSKELRRFRHFKLGRQFGIFVWIFMGVLATLSLTLFRDSTNRWLSTVSSAMITVLSLYMIVTSLALIVGIFQYVTIFFGKMYDEEFKQSDKEYQASKLARSRP